MTGTLWGVFYDLDEGDPIAVFAEKGDANDFVNVWAKGVFRKYVRPVSIQWQAS